MLKPLQIKLKYLEVLEIYQTWLKIILLHLVAFKIISRVYFFRVFERFFGDPFELIYHYLNLNLILKHGHLDK
jgi:hypothetical protein